MGGWTQISKRRKRWIGPLRYPLMLSEPCARRDPVPVVCGRGAAFQEKRKMGRYAAT